ncbi:hypothetical protein [Nonomuraea salmonea]|uniref:hypothetical protein n=1 Tax=Nonomuraea salmonea TaxID=46181 RepID=UPI0031E89D1D
MTKELINAFKRMTGKENILFEVADAALGNPDDPVRAVILPAVTGGEQPLKGLVHEFTTKGPAYRTTVQHAACLLRQSLQAWPHRAAGHVEGAIGPQHVKSGHNHCGLITVGGRASVRPTPERPG